MPRSTHDLLLELLRRAATGGGLRARGPRQRSGVEALEAEGLIELRSGVHRATAEGVKVLQDRGQAPRPSGAVAVMFTDLEGSTRLMERFGEAAALGLVRRHFALLRIAVAEHHGHEVKSLGDGLMVVFGGVPDAVACAAAMQEAVAREGARVGLRIGIDAGEPVQEENDYFGMPVIIARRLCDAAAAGQTLVSEHVLKLAGEQQFEPLGGIALKGLSGPVTAGALAHESPAVPPRLPATATAG